MRVVLCNVPPDHAERIADTVVDERLAACVTASPVTSTYRWKGEVHHDPEVTLTLKVGADGVASLRKRLLALHPYECPEVVVLAVDAAMSHGPYVDWVRAESQGR